MRDVPWRNFFLQSPQAVSLERSLSPNLRESQELLKSTASTDVKHRCITLDVSQPPLKCALSYAYELKNLEHAELYLEIIALAKSKKINKKSFIRQIINLEAEAIYFRCQVFYEIGVNREDFPCKQVYLDIYSLSRNKPKSDVIKEIALYIKDNGVVRREYAAKKYYSDSYDFHTGSKAWPSHYSERRTQTVFTAFNDIKSKLSDFKLEDNADNADNTDDIESQHNSKFLE